MPTKTATKNVATKNVATKTTGMTLAEAIVNAKTPGEKSQATRKLNKYLDARVAEGAVRKQVEAGVKSWVTRLRNGN